MKKCKIGFCNEPVELRSTKTGSRLMFTKTRKKIDGVWKVIDKDFIVAYYDIEQVNNYCWYHNRFAPKGISKVLCAREKQRMRTDIKEYNYNVLTGR